MIEAIIIGGEPGTGKTTVVREFVKELKKIDPDSRAFSFLKVKGLVFPNTRIVVIGFGYTNENEKFAGTDKLSMAVQPDAVRWFAGMRDKEQMYTAVLEGDRLCNSKFIESLRNLKIPTGLILFNTSWEEKKRRYEERGSNQSETFIFGRVTKCKNLTNLYNPEVWENETRIHIAENVAKLLKLCGQQVTLA